MPFLAFTFSRTFASLLLKHLCHAVYLRDTLLSSTVVMFFFPKFRLMFLAVTLVFSHMWPLPVWCSQFVICDLVVWGTATSSIIISWWNVNFNVQKLLPHKDSVCSFSSLNISSYTMHEWREQACLIHLKDGLLKKKVASIFISYLSIISVPITPKKHD